MLPPLNKIKNIPPGIILERELRLQKIKKTELAASINELPQMISYICNGKRAISTKLSLKLDKFFGVEEGYFILLQTYNNIISEQKNNMNSKSPPVPQIRKAIFWDTDYEKLDWEKHKKSIIQRIFERGNEDEIKDIISWYGKETVTKTIQNVNSLFFTAIENAVKHLGIDKNTISCYINSTQKQPQQPYYTSSAKFVSGTN